MGERIRKYGRGSVGSLAGVRSASNEARSERTQICAIEGNHKKSSSITPNDIEVSRAVVLGGIRRIARRNKKRREVFINIVGDDQSTSPDVSPQEKVLNPIKVVRAKEIDGNPGGRTKYRNTYA